MTRFLRPALAAAALALMAACSSPAGLSSTSGAAASLNAVDRTFVSQASYGSHGEIALGTLAMEQGGAPAVRQFGQMMVEQHTQMNQDLVAITTDRGMAPPTAPDPGRQAVGAALGELSGSAFDQQYVPQQLADHEVTLTLFQGQIRSGADSQLRAFAQRYAPVIEQHIVMLRQLETTTVAGR